MDLLIVPSILLLQSKNIFSNPNIDSLLEKIAVLMFTYKHSEDFTCLQLLNKAQCLNSEHKSSALYSIQLRYCFLHNY